MIRSRVLAGALLVSGWWAGAAVAQTPAPSATAATAAAAEAAKPGFCERIEQGIDRKRRKLCQTPLGNMLNSISRPFNTFTGGIIPNFCPGKPSEEDLKKPGAEGAAAQAAKDAAEAQARRKAVRLMGTFDCHWYPEVEAGLVAALRTDRAECVRLEAAIALNRGCCCTRAIVEALEETVAGTDKLGPSENSPRVQAVAMMALERCLTCPEAMEIIEAPPADDKEDEERPTEEMPAPKRVEPGTDKPKTGRSDVPATLPASQNAASAKRGSGKPSRALLEKAHRTLALAKAREARTPISASSILPAGERSLAGLARYAVHGGNAPSSQVVRVQHVNTRLLPESVTAQGEPTLAQSSAAGRPAESNSVSYSAELPDNLRTTPNVRPGRATSPYRPVEIEFLAAQATNVDPKVSKYLETLQNATDAEIRHSAVLALAALDWHEHPAAVSSLLHAARHDSHAGLRVACIRSLVRMKAATPEVITGLRPMIVDTDEWIRQETIHALAALQKIAEEP